MGKHFFFRGFLKATFTKAALVQQNSCTGEEANEQATSPDVCKGAGHAGCFL